jgi:hypothetical protein
MYCSLSPVMESHSPYVFMAWFLIKHKDTFIRGDQDLQYM